MLNNIEYSILISDKDAKYIFVNDYLLKRSKATKEAWLGKTPQQMIENGVYDKSIILEVFRTKKAVSGFLHMLVDNKLSMSTCTPIFETDGSIKYVVTISIVPERFNALVEQLKAAEERENAYQKEIELLRKELLLSDQLVFASKEMYAVLSLLNRLASVDCTVLITGESGVGKEVVAKTIHQKSQRRTGPFVPVCVPAIPANLLESELFGYAEGAFTGSNKKGKPGLIEIADKGTLFLDELGEIPYDLQVKLLRVIETGEVTRVGSVKPRKIDFRIIAATNKDIYKMADNNQFREDLLYRLSVVDLHIKPLRERRADIIPLAEHFLSLINQKYGFAKKFSANGRALLHSLDWPGNARQLKNSIEKICILSNTDIIDYAEIQTALNLGQARDSVHRHNSGMPAKTLDEAYNDLEKQTILDALIKANGNKSQAAKLLKMPRSKLYRRLKEISPR